jgi:hypothetical protein
VGDCTTVEAARRKGNRLARRVSLGFGDGCRTTRRGIDVKVVVCGREGRGSVPEEGGHV